MKETHHIAARNDRILPDVFVVGTLKYRLAMKVETCRGKIIPLMLQKFPGLYPTKIGICQNRLLMFRSNPLDYFFCFLLNKKWFIK